MWPIAGSERHWSEVQIIGAPEVTEGDLFGDSLALHNDRLVIGMRSLIAQRDGYYLYHHFFSHRAYVRTGARGRNTNAGVAYIYERPSGKHPSRFDFEVPT